METQVWRGYKKKDELTQEQEDWRQVFGYGKACPGKPAEAEWLQGFAVEIPPSFDKVS